MGGIDDAVTFLKVYSISFDFMETKTALRVLRLAFGAWVMVLADPLTSIYLQ
ncbi:hypothetical protein MycrhDRAFT_5212 [Mycolicibacterium rhodesiae JS60]|nr:hypothetical protein MycrhDRAFT_5212 [Mycolicibacterium rhodesiae JS60]